VSAWVRALVYKDPTRWSAEERTGTGSALRRIYFDGELLRSMMRLGMLQKKLRDIGSTDALSRELTFEVKARVEETDSVEGARTQQRQGTWGILSSFGNAVRDYV